jgi:drug/metabolite transporter (DMT)-like permease
MYVKMFKKSIMKTQSKSGFNLNTKTKAILMAILAAALYGLSSPFSKLLLLKIPPALMASLLYLGAGLGMTLVYTFQTLRKVEKTEAKITKHEYPYIIAMIALDIAAPILLMFGLTQSASSSVALLNNFEIVATSLIALFIFKEAIGKRMWIAITLITVSSILLSVQDFNHLTFSLGSLYVLLACVCWGLENNCTRLLSLKDPLQIVIIKGLGSGLGSLLIWFMLKEQPTEFIYILYALLLGFFAYGLSIFFYISAQRNLGASRVSAYYAAAPFIGVLISWIVLQESISLIFLVALSIMLGGAYLAISEMHRHTHIHPYEVHEHKHNHSDQHHNHTHDTKIDGEHSHIHTHESMQHEHDHLPDTHHHHKHK